MEEFVQAECRAGALAVGGYPFPVAFEQIDDSGCRIECLVGSFGNTVEEEFKPGFPGAALTDFLEQPIVIRAVGLQIQAEIQLGLRSTSWMQR